MLLVLSTNVDIIFCRYDILIDADLRVWLLEVNASSSLSAETSADYDLKYNLLQGVALSYSHAPKAKFVWLIPFALFLSYLVKPMVKTAFPFSLIGCSGSCTEYAPCTMS